MAYTKNEAVEIAKTFLIQAAKKHPIRSAYLFGSYAKGIQRDYSDIDIAAVFSEAIEQKNIMKRLLKYFMRHRNIIQHWR